MDTITWNEFERVEVRAGTIVKAEIFEEARKPAYKLWIDLGELGVKKSSAQITKIYTCGDLVGLQVLCVCNFPEKQIGPMRSQVLTTGFPQDDGSVVLAVTERQVPDGSRLA